MQSPCKEGITNTLALPIDKMLCLHVLVSGWSELAATNAPVEDEPVQPVLRMNILPARGVFFFSPLLCPTYLPPPTLNLPPPSYLPPTNPTPPSLHCQSSSCGAEAVAVELLLWSCCCGVRAGARAPTRPTHPRSGKMLTFFFFFCVCFV